MKKSIPIMATGLLLLALSCGQEEPNKSKKVAPREVKKETKAALQTAKTYALQEKEAYQKKLNNATASMQTQIDALRAKAEKAAPAAKAKMQEQVKDLQAKLDSIKKKFKEWAAATGKAWEDMKTGLNKSLADWQKVYEKAKKEF